MCALVEDAHRYVLWCTWIYGVVHIGIYWRCDWLVTLVAIGIL